MNFFGTSQLLYESKVFQDGYLLKDFGFFWNYISKWSGLSVLDEDDDDLAPAVSSNPDAPSDYNSLNF